MSKEILINGKWPLKLPDSAADEWTGNMLYHNNTWEMPRLLVLEKMIKDGPHLAENKKPVVLYIGAYKGDMAALLATWGADLILVEATAGFWPEIKETWELNNLPKPLGMFSGLSSRVTTSDLTKEQLQEWPERSEPFVEGTTGFAHLAESGGHFPEMSIDDLCKRLGVVPDIITMDIEGSELEAAYGSLSMIVDNKPAWLISVHPEFMFHNHNTYERELHDLLRNNKYLGTWLDYDHEHHWLYEMPQ
jgi:FkbM family methyltransferase